MRIMWMGLLVMAWSWESAAAAERSFSAQQIATLQKAEIYCHTTEFHSTSVGEGIDESRFQINCFVSPALQSIIQDMESATLTQALKDSNTCYAGHAALAALGRFHQLPSPERMRFALEFARREREPFASARVSFEFGDRNSWKGVMQESQAQGNRRYWILGHLPAPFDREMTPVLQEYLFYSEPKRRPSTLACYLAKIMGDSLGAQIASDLRKVIAWDPKSFEAEMANAALLNLDQAKRLASGSFDFNARIGLVSRRQDGCIIMNVQGEPTRIGTTVQVIRVLHSPQTFSKASVVDAPLCRAQDKKTPSNKIVLGMGEVVLDAGEVAIGIVAPPDNFKILDKVVKADLDQDGVAEAFRSCTSTEGEHLTVWSGDPIQGSRRWHAYHYLGYDVEPNCLEKEVEAMPPKSQ